MSDLSFSILAFSTNFFPIKIDLSGNTVWPQASDFQKLAKMDQFWHFKLTFVTQNVNVARFALNVDWDFFCDFQLLCKSNLLLNYAFLCIKDLFWPFD